MLVGGWDLDYTLDMRTIRKQDQFTEAKRMERRGLRPETWKMPFGAK